MVNENVSFSSIVTVKDSNGQDVQVMNLYGSLDKANMNMSINVNTMNKELATEKATEVQAQYEEFRVALESRAIELGFVILGGAK